MGFEGIRRESSQNPLLDAFQVLDKPVPPPSAPSVQKGVSAWTGATQGAADTEGFLPPRGTQSGGRDGGVAELCPWGCGDIRREGRLLEEAGKNTQGRGP